MQKIAKQKFSITGMTCTACSAHMEKVVRKLNGVQTADVSLMTNSMTAEYDEGILSPEDIIRAVIQSGYRASLPAFLLGHKNAVAFGLTQPLLTFPIMYINDKYYKV